MSAVTVHVPSGTSDTAQIAVQPALKGGSFHRLVGLLFVVVRLAHSPELLVELKGAPLSVLLALALRANKKGSCFPSIDRLTEDTGYSRSSVCKALNQLEEAGFVERIRRQRQSTLYVLQPLRLNEDAGGVKDEAEAETSKEPAAEAAVESATKAVSTGEVSGKRRTSGASPAKRASAEADQRESDQPRQMHFEEWTDVAGRMRILGIAEVVIEELVERHKALGHTPRYVEAWLKAYQDGLQAKRIYGPGWLVTALRRDWELPAAYREAALSGSERRRRYISGKFAEYIEH